MSRAKLQTILYSNYVYKFYPFEKYSKETNWNHDNVQVKT